MFTDRSTAPARLSIPRPAAPSRPGKARTAILLWLLGVPIPIIIIIFLVRGCMG